MVSVIKSRRLRWAGHVTTMEEGMSSFKMLTGKRPFGRPRRRWEEILEWTFLTFYFIVITFISNI